MIIRIHLKGLILFSFTYFTLSSALAQSIKNDLQIIENHQWNSGDSYTISPMKINSTHWFIKYNPVSLILTAFMFTYQKLISPQISADCLYTPSCSNFSKNAIQEFGILKGTALTADRLLRCNRISESNIHPQDINLQSGKAKDFPSRYKR